MSLLPVDVDATYADNAADASVKTHQQHHDLIHGRLNGINQTFTGVGTQAAMLALAAQRGDFAIRTDFDPDGVFRLAGDDPTLLANWIRIGAVDLASDGAANVPSLRTLGTGAAQAAKGDSTVNLTGDQPIDGQKTMRGDFYVNLMFRALRDPWVDASRPEFAGGVKGVVTTDSTAAMQAFVDFMRDIADAPPKPWRAPIAEGRLPPGFIKITDPGVKFEGFLGAKIRGAGLQLTYLRAFGTMNRMLDFDGFAYGLLEEMTIDSDGGFAGSADVSVVLHFRRDPAVATQGVTQNLVRRVGITNCRFRQGIIVGLDGQSTQADSQLFEKVHVYGGLWNNKPGGGLYDVDTETTYFQELIRIGSTSGGNNFLHTLIDVHLLGGVKGLVNALSGVSWTGGSFGNNGSDIYFAGLPSYSVFRDFRTEGSRRLMNCSASSTAASVIELANILYVGNRIHPDGEWIRDLFGGLTKLTNIEADLIAGITAKILLSSGGTPALCQVKGLTVPNVSVADAFTLGNNANEVEVEGLCLIDHGSIVKSVKGGRWRGSRPTGTVTWRHSEELAETVKTASYTLALHDANSAIAMNVASANNLTVPTTAAVAFPVGTVIEVYQMGAGQTTLVFSAGVTPRSSGGKLKLSAQHAVVSLRKKGGADEVQKVVITGLPTGGTYTLTYSGQTTTAIAYNANAATVQAALEALSNVGAGNVVVTLQAGIVTGTTFPGAVLGVRFTGTLGVQDVAQMTADGSGLTGGTAPTVTVSTVTAGSADEWVVAGDVVA